MTSGFASAAALEHFIPTLFPIHNCRNNKSHCIENVHQLMGNHKRERVDFFRAVVFWKGAFSEYDLTRERSWAKRAETVHRKNAFVRIASVKRTMFHCEGLSPQPTCRLRRFWIGYARRLCDGL